MTCHRRSFRTTIPNCLAYKRLCTTSLRDPAKPKQQVLKSKAAQVNSTCSSPFNTFASCATIRLWCLDQTPTLPTSSVNLASSRLWTILSIRLNYLQ